MKRAAIYVRVSTGTQADADRYGLEAQTHACHAYARSHGLEVTSTYQDVISGTTETRAGLERLLKESARYSAVIVFAIDRLARSVPVAYALLSELQQAGLEVHSTAEGVQTLADDGSALRFGIYAVFADHERRRITTRLMNGRLAKVRRGLPVVPLHGYGFHDGVIHEDEARWVRWIFERVPSTSLYRLAHDLNDRGITAKEGSRWNTAKLATLVRNPLYRGEYSFAKQRPGRKATPDMLVTCEVPAIVTLEDWQRAQVALDRRAGNRGRPGKRLVDFPLQGRIVCGSCGSGMSAQYNRPPGHPRRLGYYFCRRTRTLPEYAISCSHRRTHNAPQLHASVTEFLRRLLRNDRLLSGAIATVAPAPRLDTTRDRERLRAELSRAKRAYLGGVFELDEYTAERDRLEAAIAILEIPDAEPARPDLSGWRDRIRQVLADQDNLASVARDLDFVVTVNVDRTLIVSFR